MLNDGEPAIAWVDLGGKPYYMHFLVSGTKVVYGYVDDHFCVDHLANEPYLIPSDMMAEARSRIPSYRNRLVTISSGGDFDMKKAISAGLQDHIDFLGAKSDSFALPSIRKWARMMTDPKNSKSWPSVFKNGRGLYGTLRDMYQGIVHAGSGGDGLRGLYASFLEEASDVMGQRGA